MTDKYGRTIRCGDVVFIDGDRKSYDVEHIDAEGKVYLLPHWGERTGTFVQAEGSTLTISPNSIDHRMAEAGLLKDEDANRYARFYDMRQAAAKAAKEQGLRFDYTILKNTVNYDDLYTFTGNGSKLVVKPEEERWWLELEKAAIALALSGEAFTDIFTTMLSAELARRLPPQS